MPRSAGPGRCGHGGDRFSAADHGVAVLDLADGPSVGSWVEVADEVAADPRFLLVDDVPGDVETTLARQLVVEVIHYALGTKRRPPGTELPGRHPHDVH